MKLIFFSSQNRYPDHSRPTFTSRQKLCKSEKAICICRRRCSEQRSTRRHIQQQPVNGTTDEVRCTFAASSNDRSQSATKRNHCAAAYKCIWPDHQQHLHTEQQCPTDRQNLQVHYATAAAPTKYRVSNIHNCPTCHTTAPTPTAHRPDQALEPSLSDAGQHANHSPSTTPTSTTTIASTHNAFDDRQQWRHNQIRHLAGHRNCSAQSYSCHSSADTFVPTTTTPTTPSDAAVIYYLLHYNHVLRSKRRARRQCVG